MANYLVCHGAWSGGWSWAKVRPLIEQAGHSILTPTYTGLGDRSHLASPAVDLELHIRDIQAVIEYEDARDLILVGHSYGGMVATGVADRMPSGSPGSSISTPSCRATASRSNDFTASGRRAGVGDRRLADAADAAGTGRHARGPRLVTGPRRCHHPARCFSQKLRVAGAATALPAHLHPLHEEDRLRRVPAVRRRASAGRPGLDLPRHGRQPQPEHHRARGAGRRCCFSSPDSGARRAQD
jgi:pimeloyl-ACP methyl ester carboxylesterase